MSRQSKNAKKRELAKQFTELHKKGEKGPSSTGACHGKRVTYRHNEQLKKARDEACVRFRLKGHEKTVLEQMNDKKAKQQEKNRRNRNS